MKMAEVYKHKHPVGSTWRLDETYMKLRGQWKYFYRAIDKEGNTVDFFVTAKRDPEAALQFFKHSIKNRAPPE